MRYNQLLPARTRLDTIANYCEEGAFTTDQAMLPLALQKTCMQKEKLERELSKLEERTTASYTVYRDKETRARIIEVAE